MTACRTASRWQINSWSPSRRKLSDSVQFQPERMGKYPVEIPPFQKRQRRPYSLVTDRGRKSIVDTLNERSMRFAGTFLFLLQLGGVQFRGARLTHHTQHVAQTVP
jgi:hypothetical protein